MTSGGHRLRRVVDVSCVLALVSLFLMSWSVVDPRPVPVFVAMSLGQIVGTFSLLLFLITLVVGVTRHPVGADARENRTTR